MGNTPSAPEAHEQKSPEKTANASPQKKEGASSPNKIQKSPGFLDKLLCKSGATVVGDEDDALPEESPIDVGKAVAEHSDTHVHIFAQPPQDNDNIATPVINPVVEKPTIKAPAFKIYPGMPEEVRKIVEEYNAKGVFVSNYPAEGFVTPHVSTHLNYSFVTQSPVKSNTYYKNTEKPIEASPEIPLRHFLINSINESLKKSPEREKLLEQITLESVKKYSPSTSKKVELDGEKKADVNQEETKVEVKISQKEEGGLEGYEGESKDGEAEGKGSKRNTDGTVLEGSWADGKLEGFGRKLFKSGELCYVGEFKAGLFHGRGVLYNENASDSENLKPLDYNDLTKISDAWKQYEGEFADGKKHGTGTLTFVNNEKFEGTFDNDEISGAGTFHTDAGKEIFGSWKNGKFTVVKKK